MYASVLLGHLIVVLVQNCQIPLGVRNLILIKKKLTKDTPFFPPSSICKMDKL